ncbi:hypothetical protein LJR168_000286 [Pseudoxanthomonas sp. LjRoot168]|uniref:hypothetical protein n=1 Tax=unclassified Pseudoxanthomonas TaxID=2645906 RepID=UPI003ECF2BA6
MDRRLPDHGVDSIDANLGHEWQIVPQSGIGTPQRGFNLARRDGDTAIGQRDA